MRALALRLTAVAVGLSIALLGAEVVARVAGSPPSPPVAAEDDRRITNSNVPRFRSLRPEPEKRPGVFRVLVVGDSFTWGWGVDHDKTYAWRLSRWLPELDSEMEFEVVNWSRPGWNTWKEWASLRRRLDELRPDLLILGYVLNDAEPTDPGERERIRRDLATRAPDGAVGRTLYRWSWLARRLHGALENRRLRRALIEYYHSLYEGEGWQASKGGLRRLRRAARAVDSRMMMVLFPIFDSQLDERYAYRDLHTQVMDAAEALKIPALDLLPAFEPLDARELAVVPFTDAHPSALAHEIAAREILDFALERRLIPARMPADQAANGQSQASTLASNSP